jgi:hypothetical protein
MRNQNHFFDKALLYYGSYKGVGLYSACSASSSSPFLYG